MEREPIRWWFVAAWSLLIVVVAIGFLIQARTINRVEDDENQFEQLVMEQQARDATAKIALCGVFLSITDEVEHQDVVRAFQDIGVVCPKDR